MKRFIHFRCRRHPPPVRGTKGKPIVLAVVLLTVAFAGCAEDDPDPAHDEVMKPARSISEVLRDHSPRLMNVDGVVGVYEGLLESGDACITVMLRTASPGIEREIGPELEGYPVRLEIVGEIRPLR